MVHTALAQTCSLWYSLLILVSPAVIDSHMLTFVLRGHLGKDDERPDFCACTPGTLRCFLARLGPAYVHPGCDDGPGLRE